MPGEVSLAHNGVLYLDELPEFRREVLEVLRQPLEDRVITIARAKNTVTYPSSVMLVASMNPCPCGYYNHPTHECTCTESQVRKYLGRISGPLLDRIDLQIEIRPLSFEEMSRHQVSESSASIRERVLKARRIQEERFAQMSAAAQVAADGRTEIIHCNAQMGPAQLRQYCPLDEASLRLLRNAMSKLDLSARAYDRILRVARTIADYEGCESITSAHIAEAISYRNLDKHSWGQG